MTAAVRITPGRLGTRLQLPTGDDVAGDAGAVAGGRRPSGRPASIMARRSGSSESVPKN